MVTYYSITFAISLVLSLVYVQIWHKHFDVHFTLIFTFVPIANLGFLLGVLSVNLEEAILANDIKYLGCFLMLFSLPLSSSAGSKTAFSAGMGIPALAALLLPLVFSLPVDTGYPACVFLLFPLCLLGRKRQAGLGFLLFLAGLAPMLLSGNWASAAGWALTAPFLLWISSGSWLAGILSFLSGAAGLTAAARSPLRIRRPSGR